MGTVSCICRSACLLELLSCALKNLAYMLAGLRERVCKARRAVE